MICWIHIPVYMFTKFILHLTSPWVFSPCKLPIFAVSAKENSLHIIIAWISATSILGGWVVLLGCSNPSLFTKSLSWVFILLLKLAIQVGLPLVEVLVCPVGPLIFPSLSSDHFLLSLINCAFVALLSFARGTQSIRLQKMQTPHFWGRDLHLPKNPRRQRPGWTEIFRAGGSWTKAQSKGPTDTIKSGTKWWALRPWFRYWLVVLNMFFLSFHILGMECHHPNWLSVHHFSEG